MTNIPMTIHDLIAELHRQAIIKETGGYVQTEDEFQSLMQAAAGLAYIAHALVEARNYVTSGVEVDGQHYELTLRRSGRMTPAEQVAVLEAKLAREREAVVDADARAEKAEEDLARVMARRRHWMEEGQNFAGEAYDIHQDVTAAQAARDILRSAYRGEVSP